MNALRISSSVRIGTYLVSIPRTWHIGQKKKKKENKEKNCIGQINLSFALKGIWEESKQNKQTKTYN